MDATSNRAVSPGERLNIPATTWNDVISMLRWWRLQGNAGGGPVEFTLSAQTTAVVLNSTGFDLAFGEVVTCVTPSTSPVDYPEEWRRFPVMVATTPGVATDQPFIAIEPILDGEFGRVATLGLVPCMVDVYDSGTSALRPGDYVQPIASTRSKLRKASTGPGRLLWYQTVSGSQDVPRRAVVLLGGASGGSGTTTGPIYARLTGRSGGKYSFVQVTRDGSGVYGDVSGGITGNTSTTYAQDIGGLANDILFTPTNLPFLLTPNPTVSGTWLFGPVSLCS